MTPEQLATAEQRAFEDFMLMFDELITLRHLDIAPSPEVVAQYDTVHAAWRAAYTARWAASWRTLEVPS